MKNTIGKVVTLTAVVAVTLLAVLWQILYNSEVGMAKDIGILDLPAIDYVKGFL